MTTLTTKERINNIAMDYLMTGDAEELDFTKSIYDEYGADGLDEIEILMALEEEFGIEIPDDNYETMDNFLKAVETALKG